MKVRALISCIPLLILVLLLSSMATQATEYREVNTTVKADDVLKHIENGEDINITNCRIVGELNISNIKLEIVTNPFFNTLLKQRLDEWKWEKETIKENGINENLNVINTKISITNSNFENTINLSNVIFKKPVSFEETSFKDVNFMGTIYSNSVNFSQTNFDGSANFFGANFGNSVSFKQAYFLYYANFCEANFGDFADFSFVNFSSGSSFGAANFGNYADFGEANFGDNDKLVYYDSPLILGIGHSAGFSRTSFGNSIIFFGTEFGNSATFLKAHFGDNAVFYEVHFGEMADFFGTNFGNFALFKSVYYNDTVEFYGPDTSENIVTDAKTCELFRRYYKNEARYEDADNIYYNYRRYYQGEKSLISLSKWTDILSWITCGYGLRPLRALYTSGFFIGLFALLYWQGQGLYQSSETKEKKWNVSSLDALLFSVREFTTLGSADWLPRDNFRILATIEGVLGYVMLAIFLATLTNVMIRS